MPKQVDELPDSEQAEREQIEDPRPIPAEVDPVDARESDEREAPEGIPEPVAVRALAGLGDQIVHFRLTLWVWPALHDQPQYAAGVPEVSSGS